MTSWNWCALAGVGFALACGDAGDAGGLANDGSGGISTDGGSGGSSSGSGGSGEEEPDAPPLRLQLNWVPLSSVSSTPRLAARSLRILSGPDAPDLPPLPCETLEAGSCSVRICDVPDEPAVPVEPDPNVEPFIYADAGTISAHFDATPENEVADAVMTPDVNGSYEMVNFTGDGFRGGETGMFSATGGELSGFELPVTIPLTLVLTAPGAPDGALTASREAALKLTWDRGAAETYLYLQTKYLSTTTDSEHSYSLNCSFDSTAGSGTIEQSLLSRLPVGFGANIYTVRKHTANPGPDRTEVWVIGDVYDSAKTAPVVLTLGE